MTLHAMGGLKKDPLRRVFLLIICNQIFHFCGLKFCATPSENHTADDAQLLGALAGDALGAVGGVVADDVDAAVSNVAREAFDVELVVQRQCVDGVGFDLVDLAVDQQQIATAEGGRHAVAVCADDGQIVSVADVEVLTQPGVAELHGTHLIFDFRQIPSRSH